MQAFHSGKLPADCEGGSAKAVQTLQLALLEQHLEVGVQLLPPLLNKVRSRVVIEEALGRQLQSVCWHLCSLIK